MNNFPTVQEYIHNQEVNPIKKALQLLDRNEIKESLEIIWLTIQQIEKDLSIDFGEILSYLESDNYKTLLSTTNEIEALEELLEWTSLFKLHTFDQIFFNIPVEASGVTHTFKVIRNPEGGYTGVSEEFSGCITQGENLSQLEEMAKEAISLYLEN